MEGSTTIQNVVTNFVARIVRRRFWFAATLVLSLAGVAAAFVLLPRTYLGTAKIIIGSDDMLLAGPATPQTTRAVDNADVESQIVILRSSTLLGRLLEDPAFRGLVQADCEAARQGQLPRLRARILPYSMSCEELATTPAFALERLDANLLVTALPRSRVVDIGFFSASPEIAAAIPNAILAAYLAQDRARRVQPREQASAWINEQIRVVAAELQESQAAMERLRSQNGMFEGREAPVTNEQLSALAAQLTAAQALRSTLASRIAGNPNATMNRRSYEEADAQVRDLVTRFEDMSRLVGQQTRVEVALAALRRDVQVRQQTFLNLSSRGTELEVQGRLLSGSAQAVASAYVPIRLATPNTVRLLGGGVLLSMVLAAAVALLRDAMDGTVRSAARLSQQTGLPVLGVIPEMGSRHGALGDDAWLAAPSALKEAMRALVSRILRRCEDRCRVLLLASTDPAEGKTFIAVALARYAAAAGKRVLLIEADLRRPSFHRYLPLPTSTGLSDLLTGRVDVHEATQSSGFSRLDVITSGHRTDDSLELLSGPGMGDLLELARRRYDLVVVDSPPTGWLSDAAVLSAEADEVLYCAAWGGTNSDRVSRSITNFLQDGGRVTGVVVNRASLRTYPLYDSQGSGAGGAPTLSLIAGSR